MSVFNTIGEKISVFDKNTQEMKLLHIIDFRDVVNFLEPFDVSDFEEYNEYMQLMLRTLTPVVATPEDITWVACKHEPDLNYIVTKALAEKNSVVVVEVLD